MIDDDCGTNLATVRPAHRASCGSLLKFPSSPLIDVIIEHDCFIDLAAVIIRRVSPSASFDTSAISFRAVTLPAMDKRHFFARDPMIQAASFDRQNTNFAGAVVPRVAD